MSEPNDFSNLTKSQIQIVKEYTNKCHPLKNSFMKRDLELVYKLGLVDKDQDHITDRGAAFVVAELGVPFTKFLENHTSWKGRLQQFINHARQWTKNDDEFNAYFKAKYKLLLKYDLFQPNNAERMPDSDKIRSFVAEIGLDMLEQKGVSWQSIRDMFNSSLGILAGGGISEMLKLLPGMDWNSASEGAKQLGGDISALVKNKEDLVAMLKSQL